MKKSLLVILTLILIIPLTVFAQEYPKVLTLNTEISGNTINYSGTTESGSHAVMCKLYDSNDKEIDKLSVAVNNSKFEGSFETDVPGDYKVSCANYEGGTIKAKSASVVEEPETYTVEFDTVGGSQINSAEVTSGQKVSKPTPDPTKKDKIFGGWFEDDTYAREFDFDTPITDNITLVALWNDPEKFRVEFDTRCEQGIEPVDVISGQKVSKPSVELTKKDKVFGGWFEDDTFTREFDFDTPITDNTTLFALWNDPEIEEEEYTVNDEKGNTVVFTEEEGHNYKLTIIDYLSYSKEEVMEMANISEKEYDEVFSSLKNAVKDQGELVSIFEIVLTDENEHEVTDKEITIKIKLTEEMKKYNTLKLIYVKDDNTIEDPIILKVEGNYAVGTLKHLSTYVLTGSNTSTSDSTSSNPKTGDNIYIWYTLFAISVLGLSVGMFNAFKLRKQKVR